MKQPYGIGDYMNKMTQEDLVREADPEGRYAPGDVMKLAVGSFPQMEPDGSLSPR